MRFLTQATAYLALMSTTGILPLPLKTTSTLALAQPEPAIALLLEAQGVLEPGDTTLPDGTLADAYRFEGIGGETVTILLESNAFDTFLYLLDAQGKTVAVNDDISTTNSNSAIIVPLPENGVYQVFANAFDQQGQGAYSLAVMPTVANQPNPLLSDVEVQQVSAGQLLEAGRRQYETSQNRAAVESWQQALDIYRALGDRAGEGSVLNNMGLAYRALGQYSQSVDYHSQALNIAQAIKDRSGEATALSNLGLVYAFLGDNQQAIDFSNQALEIFQDLNNYNAYARTLNTLGIAYYSRREYSKSIEFYTQALAIFRDTQDQGSEGDALNGLGLANQFLGQYEQAIEFYNQSLRIAQEIDYPKAELNALGNLGNVYLSTGKYQEAIDVYHQSLSISQEIEDPYGVINSLNNLGSVYRTVGSYEEAADFHAQALTIAREIGDRRGEGVAIASIGDVYNSVGDYQESIQYYLEALAIAQEVGNYSGEGATLNNLGIAYFSLDDYQKAIEIHSEALGIAREISDQNLEITALNGLGNAQFSNGEQEEAIAAHSQALEIAQSLGDLDSAGTALNNLGNVYGYFQDYQKAIDFHSQALNVFQDIGNPEGQGTTLTNLGTAYQQLGQLSQAEQSFESAIQVWEDLRAENLTPQNQLSLLDQQSLAYRYLQDVLMAQERSPEALEVSERGRTRALITALGAQLPAEVRENLNLASPSVQEMKQVATEQNATLVEYSILVDAVLIWVIRPNEDSIIAHSSPLPNRETLENLTSIFPLLSGNGQGDRANSPDVETIDRTLEQLYTLLIAPILDVLPKEDTERVIFIPHQDLFRVPFAALRNPDTYEYLIEKHTILTAPSIQALSLTREHRNRADTSSIGGALVVGNPAISQELMTTMAWDLLDGAEPEAKKIAELLGVTPLLGPQATENTIRQQMPQARYIHFATHGALSADNNSPTSSLAKANYNRIPGFLALTPTLSTETAVGFDQPQDGLLTAAEVIALASETPLNAELVVLSACQTGTGPITSDGNYGLSYAFTIAGASSLIVSLWDAPDTGTRYLMEDFYTELNSGKDKAQALRHAMLSEMKKNPDPSYWAAFTLIGQAD